MATWSGRCSDTLQRLWITFVPENHCFRPGLMMPRLCQTDPQNGGVQGVFEYIEYSAQRCKRQFTTVNEMLRPDYRWSFTSCRLRRYTCYLNPHDSFSHFLSVLDVRLGDVRRGLLFQETGYKCYDIWRFCKRKKNSMETMPANAFAELPTFQHPRVSEKPLWHGT